MTEQELPKKLWPFIWYFIRRQATAFGLFAVLSLAWSLDQTLFPYVFGKLIDTIATYSGPRTDIWDVILPLIYLALGLWVGTEGALRIAGFIFANAVPKLEARVRLAMFDYVQGHSYTYFATNFSGNIANRIAEMPGSMTQVVALLMSLILPAAVAILITSYLFWDISPLSTQIMWGWIVIHFGICIWHGRSCTYYANLHSASRSLVTGKIVDSLTNQLPKILFARRRFEFKYLRAHQQDEQEKNRRMMIYVEWIKTLLALTTLLGAWLGINGWTLYSWSQGWITLGDVVMIFNVNWNLTMIIWWAGLELPTFFKEMGVCRQALSLIEDHHEIQDKPNATELRVTKGEIAFKNVEFWYAGTTPFFSNKSITIAPGEKVGLVGLSGSGKSTFVNLILRLYDIRSGQILIDGQDIRDVTQISLREAIGTIPQEPILFHRPLIENIRYGRPNATDEEVIDAAKKAHAHDFIMHLPEGYQTLVGERGAKLSGGQRQRIAIARAILKNAPILILDEATSALDSITEQHIQDSLTQLMQGKTVLVVAHRLSTLSFLDRILVFMNGRIVEDGSHQALLEKNGHYAKLWQMQTGGLLPYKEP